MTYATNKRRLELHMNSFIDFLPYCETKEQRFRLLDHIQELKYKILQIDRMTIDKYMDVPAYTETLNSEMNFRETILRIA